MQARRNKNDHDVGKVREVIMDTPKAVDIKGILSNRLLYVHMFHFSSTHEKDKVIN